jgi:hypothetical protein
MSKVKKWLPVSSKSELQFEEKSVLFLMVIYLPLTSLGSWAHNFIIFQVINALNSLVYKGCIPAIKFGEFITEIRIKFAFIRCLMFNCTCFKHCVLVFCVLQNVELEPVRTEDKSVLFW